MKPVAQAIRGSVLVLAALTAHAQQSQIAYVDSSVCCMAPDGRGDTFVISWQAPNPSVRATTISVTKLDPTGQAASTFAIAMPNGGVPSAAAVDPAGNPWIVGTTAAITPTTAPTVGLIIKLNGDGTQVLSNATFGGLDPTTVTQIQAVAFDQAGNLYIAGHTAQLDFPLTKGAYISSFPTLPAPSGSTLIPHAGFGFLTKFAQAEQGSPPYTMVYSTLLGGLSLPDIGGFPPLPMTDISALAVDSSGIATAAGVTTAADFPVTADAYKTLYEGNFTSNVFVTRFNSQGSALLWSMFLGVGNLNLPVSGVALDSSGNVVVAGVASQADFPITPGALQSQFEP